MIGATFNQYRILYDGSLTAEYSGTAIHLKQPKTCSEQVEIIRAKGCILIRSQKTICTVNWWAEIYIMRLGSSDASEHSVA